MVESCIYITLLAGQIVLIFCTILGDPGLQRDIRGKIQVCQRLGFRERPLATVEEQQSLIWAEIQILGLDNTFG